MVKCIAWLFWTYLTLKLVQLVFGSRADTWEAPPTLRRRLLRGEPILFAAAFALSVPAALLSSWYLHRGYTRSLDFAADCYGRLHALDRLPDVRRRFDPFKVDEVIQYAEGSAAIAARGLDLAPARVPRLLAQTMRLHADRYAAMARQGGGQARGHEAAAIARCLQQSFLDL